MQALFEERAEPVVRLDCAGKQCVAANTGLVKDVKKGCSWRLLLVSNVGVPEDGARPGREEVICRVVPCAAVHEVNFWEPFGGSWTILLVFKVVQGESVNNGRAVMGETYLIPDGCDVGRNIHQSQVPLV